jgi:uncharacterized sporulation protein YeaH/YhbH (DUF444 family)
MPMANAVMIYMMDVSGSMGDEQKEMVRRLSWMIDVYITGQPRFQNVERRWIIHDAAAREVDRDTFFRTRESGGTRISSAYEICYGLLRDHYPSESWNIFCFHFSDGDNFNDDDERAAGLLKELLPKVNLFCYGQVEGSYGSGQFSKILKDAFRNEKKLRISDQELRVSDPDFVKAAQIFLKP